MLKMFGVLGILMVSFTTLDFVWLTLVAQSFYRQQLGHLLSDHFLLLPGIFFYLLYCVGLFVFVIQPSLKGAPLLEVFLRGCFFGLLCYATYDLTNQATLRDWPIVVTVVDIAWGATVAGVVSTLTVFLAKYLQLG